MLVGQDSQQVQTSLAEHGIARVQNQSVLFFTLVLEFLIVHDTSFHDPSHTLMSGLVEIKLNISIAMQR